MFIANHPYMGAMHTPDVNILQPVFLEGAALRLDRCDGAPPRRRRGEPRHRGAGPARGLRRGRRPAAGPAVPAGRGEPRHLRPADGERPRPALDDLRPAGTARRVPARRSAGSSSWSIASANGPSRPAFAPGDRRGRARDAGALRSCPTARSRPRGSWTTTAEAVRRRGSTLGSTKRGDRLTVDLSGSASQVAGAFNVPWASTRAGRRLRAPRDDRSRR